MTFPEVVTESNALANELSEAEQMRGDPALAATVSCLNLYTRRHARKECPMKSAIAIVLGGIALVGCSNTNPVRPDSTTGALSPGDIPSQVYTTAARPGDT